MPLDFEMLLSASPPLYAYSAFVDSQYTCFTSNECRDFDDRLSEGFLRNQSGKSPFHCTELKRNVNFSYESKNQNKEINSKSQILEYDIHADKLKVKKHVSFADDKGFDLVQVKCIPVTTPTTPKWTRSFLSLITGSIEPCEEDVSEKQWKVAHPADSFDVCQRVDKNGLALGGITETNSGAITNTITGNIAVKKVLGERNVFVRVTFDRWATHEDIPATSFINGNNDVSSDKIYDTFNFSVSIPSSAFRYEVIEFCFCCEVDGVEYWDNNEGINYRLVTTTEKNTTQAPETLSNTQKTLADLQQLSKQLVSPSDMDVWETFLNEHPYW